MVSSLGCQESQTKSSDSDNIKQHEIKNALVKLQTAYIKKDADGIMAVYSGDYSGPQGKGKAGLLIGSLFLG